MYISLQDLIAGMGQESESTGTLGPDTAAYYEPGNTEKEEAAGILESCTIQRYSRRFNNWPDLMNTWYTAIAQTGCLPPNIIFIIYLICYT